MSDHPWNKALRQLADERLMQAVRPCPELIRELETVAREALATAAHDGSLNRAYGPGNWTVQYLGAPVLEVRNPRGAPRQDPAAARVKMSYRLHPKTAQAIGAEARRTGLSSGQVIDRLAEGLHGRS